MLDYLMNLLVYCVNSWIIRIVNMKLLTTMLNVNFMDFDHEMLVYDDRRMNISDEKMHSGNCGQKVKEEN